MKFKYLEAEIEEIIVGLAKEIEQSVGTQTTH